MLIIWHLIDQFVNQFYHDSIDKFWVRRRPKNRLYEHDTHDTHVTLHTAHMSDHEGDVHNVSCAHTTLRWHVVP